MFYRNPPKRRKKKRGGPQMTASQKKAMRRYKADATRLGYGKKPKGRHQGSQVNEEIAFPSLRNTVVSWSATRDGNHEELRCMFCGAWYKEHTTGYSGQFHTWDWNDGVQLVQQTAHLAGDPRGGYLSQGPVLWAMRVLKSQDFVQLHQMTHSPTKADGQLGWGKGLLPESFVSRTPGRKAAEPLDWEPDWSVWMKHPELGLLVREVEFGEELWYTKNGDGYACDPEQCKTVSAAAAMKRAWKEDHADDLEEEIPF